MIRKPRICLPSRVHHKDKTLALNLVYFLRVRFRVRFSFRFWLSVYSAGQKYRWLIFHFFSTLHIAHVQFKHLYSSEPEFYTPKNCNQAYDPWSPILQISTRAKIIPNNCNKQTNKQTNKQLLVLEGFSFESFFRDGWDEGSKPT